MAKRDRCLSAVPWQMHYRPTASRRNLSPARSTESLWREVRAHQQHWLMAMPSSPFKPSREVRYDPHAQHFVSSLPPEGAHFALGRPGGKHDPHAQHFVSSLPPSGAHFALGRPGGEHDPHAQHFVSSLPPEGAHFALGAARRLNPTSGIKHDFSHRRHRVG